MPPGTAPQCHTTAISVSDKPFPAGVSHWGEEIVVGEGRDAGNIRLRYFEPEPRNEYWREGAFRPLVADGAGELDAGIAVEGLAIAYPRVDARVELIHAAPPPDPLFAWRRDGRRSGIVAGVFLGPMEARWGQEGLAATEAMLTRLLGWPDQERYLIRLGDGPQGYRLAVTPAAGGGAGQLAASLQWADGSATGVPLHHDPRRGAHLGDFRPPAGSAGQRALLVLQEGAEVQRIPVVFPAPPATAARGAEALGFGIDAGLAGLILDKAAGRSLDRQQIPPYSSRTIERDDPLHSLLLALAFAVLALAVWSRELKSK